MNSYISAASTPRDLYLDLLKKTITFYLFGDTPAPVTAGLGLGQPLTRKLALLPLIALDRAVDFLTGGRARLMRVPRYSPACREVGRDWPVMAFSMIGLKRLDNLQACIEDVLSNNIPGDFIETGVWRGGACIFMRAILRAFEIRDRTVWAADSFEGLPSPDPTRYPADKHDIFYLSKDYLGVSLERVKANFAAFDLLDDQVRFLKGWFRDTLPTAPVSQLAILRLDGDMYESTMDSLLSLYPKLSPGGYCIIDDFALDNCRAAVIDYRTKYGITDSIQAIDWTGVYWKKQPELNSRHSSAHLSSLQNS